MRTDKSSRDYARHRWYVRAERRVRAKIRSKRNRKGSLSYEEVCGKLGLDW